MKLATLTLGNHAWFVQDGTAYAAGAAGSVNTGAGTADRQNKPAASDPSWQYLGIISQDEVENAREEREVWAPSPGALRLYDVIEAKKQITLTITQDQMSRLNLCALFGMDPNVLQDAQTQWNPLEGRSLHGWLKNQHYDQNDTLTLIYDVYVYLKVNAAVTFGDDIVRPVLSARVLQSSLNTGAFAGLLA